jgi:N-methylhydantoinase A
MTRSIRFLGVDTGGTFTDFVVYDGEAVRTHKVLSTPATPELAVLQGIAELGLDPDPGALRVVHGSTVATNAVLEGKGVRTALVTNRGFADLLTIGRQARAALYDLQPPAVPPPVPAELCLETGGRIGADGEVLEDLTPADLHALRARIDALRPEAIAINLLFSFRDDRFERAVEAAVPPGIFVCRSSEVLPEYREYERGIATWLNAWVGPRVQGYLSRLARALGPARLSVIQSSGETMDAVQAGRSAVRLLLSGPAGGLAGARHVGRLAGRERLLTFDMGGTSTDVALVDGETRLTGEGRIGRYPVGVPMLDIHTIGAGGGSVARVDAGGVLLVGPESAGADPGPACYGRGGAVATVTDANLVLGRIIHGAFLGGRMALDVRAAREVVLGVAQRLGLGVEETAEGIVRVANEHMARALRVISVQRGIDPRDMTLLCFGGAGGLHVCALAEALGMREALSPAAAGVLSALGMLVAPPGRQLSRTLGRTLSEVSAEGIERELARLEREGYEALAREGVGPERVAVERSLDLRYRGQSFSLTVPWMDPAASARAFHAAHEARYGHRLDAPVEVVNARVGLQGEALDLRLARRTPAPPAPPERRVPMPGSGEAPLWRRDDLAVGQRIGGPALVVDDASTTFIAPSWSARLDPWGSLLLTRGSA